ncbi:ubiquinone biosynthesis hydroxylase, UbiH/UbiF/VisC/COQ6 family [Luminiphilus syltensis NOR5-1B]|uniref:Ubiquinone biosynthesis hydroxylase, UbiH/UbiF/VisC/COQ6 family n=1 Tax=Luminiphilus syltensis NOR5-1B TaxID=565045 RepID=B8KU48_9GAMM|nr:FAD-dependent monooxygenase [Luminiphilus syltensis]EED35344.1 ubiquinone biosynthesis hydroxylase, UbiH/UbiF/VisC/COQ6 family [Luminiphilus syltensis NOR5-1B]
MAQQVIIVGGGMVGFAFAVALRVRCPTIVVTLLEARELPSGEPDPLDTRASALNLYSRRLLTESGVWPEIDPHVASIQTIHVSNQGRFGSSVIDCADVGEAQLGYVCENHHIGRGLLARSEQLGINLEAPVSVEGFSEDGDGSRVTLSDGRTLRADLVVLADGGQSSLRESLGIGVQTRNVGQVAVVANVAFAGEQEHRAFERFTASGPLAMLPLPSVQRHSARFNTVWSLPEPAAETIMDLDQHALMEQLQRAFGWRLGAITAVGRPSYWPLVRTVAREQTRPGFLVAGNAAHGLHPVAGQGFNLSLRDADTFAAVAAAAVSEGRSVGSREALDEYTERAADNQRRIIDATDLLATLFNRRGWLLDFPRDVALVALDTLAPLRRQIAAMGTGQPSSMASVMDAVR